MFSLLLVILREPVHVSFALPYHIRDICPRCSCRHCFLSRHAITLITIVHINLLLRHTIMLLSLLRCHITTIRRFRNGVAAAATPSPVVATSRPMSCPLSTFANRCHCAIVYEELLLLHVSYAVIASCSTVATQPSTDRCGAERGAAGRCRCRWPVVRCGAQ
jgi:hypothetical protein